MPKTYEVVPEKLLVKLYEHPLETGQGAIPCLTYVTEGLKPLGQKEMALTISGHGAGGEPPPEPLYFFQSIYSLAEKGSTVDVGGVSRLEGDFFPGKLAVIYGPPKMIKGIDIPTDALTLVLVTTRELEVANAFGQLRLLALLGKAYRYFPFPVWTDILREELPQVAGMENSILASVPRIGSLKAYVIKEGNRVKFYPHSTYVFPGEAPPDGPFAFLTRLSPGADSCLVWAPGQKGPEAISGPERTADRLGGCFLMVSHTPGNNIGGMIEDGFYFIFDDENWQAFKSALADEKPFSASTDDGSLQFALDWSQGKSTFVNPVDGRSLTGAWNKYGPDAPRQEKPSNRLALHEIVLLSPEAEFTVNVDVDTFYAYISRLKEVAEKAPLPESFPGVWVVQVDLLPDAPPVFSTPEKQQGQELSRALISEMKKLPGIKAKYRKVQVLFYFRR